MPRLLTVGRPSLLAIACVAAFASSARADPPPARSSSFAGNYRTLVQDQKAPPAVARCIAAARDYVARSASHDRLGFTRADIAATVIARRRGAFSPRDPRTVVRTLAISGEARRRNGGGWTPVTLRCGENGDRLVAIELVAAP